MEAQPPVSLAWPHRSELLRSWSMTSGRHARVFPHGERSCDTSVSGQRVRWAAAVARISHSAHCAGWWRQKSVPPVSEPCVRRGFDWVGLGKGKMKNFAANHTQLCDGVSLARRREKRWSAVVAVGMGGWMDGWMDGCKT